jgi:glycosyltransferase involved in cell wall biosynthesis
MPPVNDKPPFVSIIVPVYNSEAVIADCVESLLAQDYPRQRFEVVVADNGSTDRTAEIMERFPVRFVSADRLRTPYAARNDGARLTMGDILAFCDADEVAAANWLSRLVSALKEGYAGAAGLTLGTKEAEGAVADFAAREATFRPGDAEMDIQLAPTGNVIYRRDVFERLGGFKEDTLTGADYDFSLRVTRQAGQKIRFVPGAMMWHHHRSTLRKLLKHEARIAYGREWVSQRHGEKRRSVPALFAWLTGRTVKSSGAALLAVLCAPHRKGSWGRAGFILIGPMMCAANVYGRLRYRLKRGVPREW